MDLLTTSAPSALLEASGVRAVLDQLEFIAEDVLASRVFSTAEETR